MFVKVFLSFIVLGFFSSSSFIETRSAPQSGEYEYIGAAKCKICHNSPTKGAQYKIWAASPHAKAMEVLSATEAKDPKCTKCHSTALAADPDLVATITVKEGVSCESCHGPGSAYKVMSVMKSREKSMAKGLIIPDEKVCRKCHNEESPNFKGFDFKTYAAKIAHPIPKDD